MKTLSEFLQKVPYQVLLLVIGAFFIFVSFFKVEDITKLKFEPLANPIYELGILGLFLLIFGVVLAVAARNQINRRTFGSNRTKIKIAKNEISVNIGQNTLAVKLGQIENAATDPATSLIVLPANEYFNDKCINDNRSSLGAFVLAKFPGKSSKLMAEIAASLQNRQSQSVVLNGSSTNAYGLGTAVYLDKPLGESFRLLIVAATTEKPGEGLRGDLGVLFTIAREAHCVARENRLSQIFLPLVGAGHGALGINQALLAQLFAWCEILYRHPGQKMSINIIIFQRPDTEPSETIIKQITDLISVACGVCDIGDVA